LKNKRKKFWITLFVGLILLFAGYQVTLRYFSEDNRRIRTSLRKALKEMYPAEADALRAGYGIKPASGSMEVDGSPGVILVHGLDEPGKVWMNLAPVLLDRGFHVWMLIYPNDQPIAESARFFLDELTLLRENGPEKVSIVAFSMGGLVAREMLTSPELDYARKVSEKKVPGVSQLVMVGTPNHGSDLARFRIFMEFREQLATLFSGDYNWLQSIMDGAGEAGLDLVPGSRFLETLNGRPQPDSVKMAVIAGMMGKGESADIENYIEGLKSRLPENMHYLAVQAEDLLNSMAAGVGDGLVSVDSAKLEGIPLNVVPGTHLSIIRNVRENSDRMPPAIPIILKYLKAD